MAAPVLLRATCHSGNSTDSSNAAEAKKQCNTLMSIVSSVDYLWFLYERWHVCPSCRSFCIWCVKAVQLYQFSWHGIYCQPIERVGEEWSDKSSQHTICSDFFPNLLFHHLLLTHKVNCWLTTIWSLGVLVTMFNIYVHTWGGVQGLNISLDSLTSCWILLKGNYQKAKSSGQPPSRVRCAQSISCFLLVQTVDLI